MLVANKMWHLFKNWRNVRISLAIGLALSISLSFGLLGKYVGGFTVLTVVDTPVKSLISVGCDAQPPATLWAIYIPPLFFHVSHPITLL